MSSKKVKLGDFLIRSKIPVDIEDNKQYKRVTIRTKHQGVSIRDFEIGSKIGTKKQFILKAGQFVLSKIDAMYGAFGIAPDEVDGAIITGNFWAYDYDKNMVSIEWLNHFTNSPDFYDLCRRASTGITHRKYLDEDFFLSYEVNLPNIDEQNNLVVSIDEIRVKIGFLETELSHQLTLLENLNQAILQEAVQGKLVPQDPNDEPASELLKRIKLNRSGFQPDPNENENNKESNPKEKNIGQKPTQSGLNRTGFKSRPRKEFPPIKPEEIPFEIPENWVWCRFGDIIDNIVGGGTPSKMNASYWNGNIPWASVKDLKGKFLHDTIDKITEIAIESSSTNLIPANNIIVCTRMGLGKICINKIDTAINQDLKAVFLNKNIEPEYFYNYYRTLKIIGSGMTVNGIKQEQLLNFDFPLPPLSEQKRIVEEIEKQFDKTKQLKEHILANQSATEQLLKALLHQAFELKET